MNDKAKASKPFTRQGSRLTCPSKTTQAELPLKNERDKEGAMMSEGPSKVTVKFFASLKDVTQCAEVSVQAADRTTLMAALGARFSEEVMAELQRDNVRIAHNQELIAATFQLRDGDEIAFLPPVTGG
ncbi:MAG TPA: hypothetical protein DER02_00605 [Gammaproteobacteria bacterium]|nr:hypothetical protein [Gammaproteobacteria bacterium]